MCSKSLSALAFSVPGRTGDKPPNTGDTGDNSFHRSAQRYVQQVAPLWSGTWCTPVRSFAARSKPPPPPPIGGPRAAMHVIQWAPIKVRPQAPPQTGSITMQTTFTPRVEEAPAGVFLPLVHVAGWFRSKLTDHSFKVPGSADTHEGAMQLARMHSQAMAIEHQRSSSKMAGVMR